MIPGSYPPTQLYIVHYLYHTETPVNRDSHADEGSTGSGYVRAYAQKRRSTASSWGTGLRVFLCACQRYGKGNMKRPELTLDKVQCRFRLAFRICVRLHRGIALDIDKCAACALLADNPY